MVKSSTTGPANLARELAAVELELKQQDLRLRERAQANQEEELALKRAEANSSWWRSPLIVAVLAASVAGLGNAAVSFMNGRSEQRLEESRAESSRILEAIKTGDTEKAAENLGFLLKSGLLTEGRAQRIDHYLKTRQPGTGAVLPTAAGRFRIEGSETLPSAVREAIPRNLNRYAAYLSRIGFSTPAREITIRPDRETGMNAYYQAEEGVIHIGIEIASDPFVPLYTYTEYVLHSEPGSRNTQSPQYGVLDTALSDYFSASFLNDPRVGRGMATIARLPQPYLRMLDNRRSFLQAATGVASESHQVGEIWGGLFWDIRTRLGREKTDRLLVRTWRALGRETQSSRLFTSFLRYLLLEAQPLGAADGAQVLAALRSRNFIPYPVDLIRRQRQGCQTESDGISHGLFC